MTGHTFDEPGERRMEETKRLWRVLKVASMLTSRPNYWKRAGLATEFEVSERAIDRDLELLRGLGYEIKRSAHGYSFVRTPALPPVVLSMQEVLALTLAAGLARDSGDIDTAGLSTALAQLESLMPAPARPVIRQQLQAHATAAQAGHERRLALQTMQRAWLERRRVRIVYATASRSGQMSERTVEPYAIYPYERSWIITAFDHLRGDVRDFKVDRIRAATLLDDTYTIPAEFDLKLKRYRGGAWGILRGEATDPVEVVLLFSSETGRWVREEGRDARMTFEDQPDGHVLVRMCVGITDEMRRWILSYGPGCRVLAPDSLCQELRTMAERTVALYESNVADSGKS